MKSHQPTFVCDPDLTRTLDNQTAQVFRAVGTLMTGRSITCVSQDDALPVLVSRLGLNKKQIALALETLSAQKLLDISKDQISACTQFPLK